jgi:hypothetical protein
MTPQDSAQDRDALVAQDLRAVLSARDAALRTPPFALLWRAAKSDSSPRVPQWRFAAVAATAVALLGGWWMARLPTSQETVTASDSIEADLVLARAMSPERQWFSVTDQLLVMHRYREPTLPQMPRISDPFKESWL